MKKIIIFIFLIPVYANSQIVELTPCNIAFEKSESIKLYFDFFKGKFPEIRKNGFPLFTAYSFPSFDPESQIVIYKRFGAYIVEFIRFDRNIYRANIYQRSHWEYLKRKGKTVSKKFILDYKIKRNKKIIRKKTAENLFSLFNNLIKNSRLPTNEELKKAKRVLDGTYFFYKSPTGCGCASSSYEGNVLILHEVIKSIKKATLKKGTFLNDLEIKKIIK